jgi:hypothetical protein
VLPCTDMDEGSNHPDKGDEQRAALRIYHGKRQVEFRDGCKCKRLTM